MEFIFSRENFVRCLVVFSIAIPLGIVSSFLVPALSYRYVEFVRNLVFSAMRTPKGTPLGLGHVAIIVANNLVPVALGFIFPLLISAYNLIFAIRHPDEYSVEAKSALARVSKARDRLSSELYFNLSAFGIAMAFAFGYFVFGLFLGYLLQAGGLASLIEGVRDIVLHAPFEVAAILISATVALGIRDSLLNAYRNGVATAGGMKQTLWALTRSKRMAITMGLSLMLVVLGAFIEVYLSAPLARGG